MSLVQSVKSVTPTNVDQPLFPSSNPTLVDPYDDGAAYDASSAAPSLTFNCTIKIPVEVSWDSLRVQQYYTTNEPSDQNDPNNPTTVSIYFVYDITGDESGNFNEYQVSVTLNDTNAEGQAIPFDQITNIFTLIDDLDPKTSRGTLVPVKRVGDY